MYTARSKNSALLLQSLHETMKAALASIQGLTGQGTALRMLGIQQDWCAQGAVFEKQAVVVQDMSALTIWPRHMSFCVCRPLAA